MRTNGLVDPAAEARAQRENDHQRWADDGGSHPGVVRGEPPADAPPAGPPPPTRTECPDRPVFHRRPAA